MEIEKKVKLGLQKVKSVGVNWDKTRAPVSDTISYFQGTFADAGRKEIIEGELVLKDGTKQSWHADAIEVTNVFEMMANAANMQTKFVEIFGE